MIKKLLAGPIGVLILIALAVPVLALSNINNAIYYGTLRATNSSTVATNVSCNVSVNSTALIAAGLINSTATDVAIRNSTGDDTPFMPGYDDNPWVVWFDSVPDNGNIDATLYTNSVNGTSYYFPGTGGMTTADNATDNLEFSDNFTLECKGYFDSTVAGNIFNKANSLVLAADGSGNLTLTLTSSDNVSVFYPNAHVETASVDGYVDRVAASEAWATIRGGAGTAFNDSGSTAYVGIYFSVTANKYLVIRRAPLLFYTASLPDGATITSATIALYGIAEVDTAAKDPYINVYTCNPISAIALENADYNIARWITTACSTLKAEADWNLTSWNTFTLNAAGKAAISKTAVSKFGMMEAHYDAPNTDPAWGGGGTLDSVYAWTSADGGANKPVLTVNYTYTVTLSVPGVTSGEHTIKATYNGTTVTLVVDEGLPTEITNSTNVSFAVANSAADLVSFASGVMPYVEYQKIYTDSGKQQDIEWEYGATFHNSAHGGDDAAPTFRTTSSDADVSASLISFTPMVLASASENESMAWGEIMTTPPTTPTTAYSENATPGIFFAPLVRTFWSLSGYPESIFWYNFAFIFILGGGILTFWAFAKNNVAALFLKCIVMTTIMVFWALPGPNIYGMYVVIYFVFFCFGVLVLSKNYGW